MAGYRTNRPTRSRGRRSNTSVDYDKLWSGGVQDDPGDGSDPEYALYKKLLELETANHGKTSMIPYYSGPRPAKASQRLASDIIRQREAKKVFTVGDKAELDRLRRKFDGKPAPEDDGDGFDPEVKKDPEYEKYVKLQKRKLASHGQTRMTPYYSGPRPAKASERLAFDAVLSKMNDDAYTVQDAAELARLEKKFRGSRSGSRPGGVRPPASVVAAADVPAPAGDAPPDVDVDEAREEVRDYARLLGFKPDDSVPEASRRIAEWVADTVRSLSPEFKKTIDESGGRGYASYVVHNMMDNVKFNGVSDEEMGNWLNAFGEMEDWYDKMRSAEGARS